MKYKVETTFHVDHGELDRAINEYYGWGSCSQRHDDGRHPDPDSIVPEV